MKNLHTPASLRSLDSTFRFIFAVENPNRILDENFQINDQTQTKIDESFEMNSPSENHLQEEEIKRSEEMRKSIYESMKQTTSEADELDETIHEENKLPKNMAETFDEEGNQSFAKLDALISYGKIDLSSFKELNPQGRWNAKWNQALEKALEIEDKKTKEKDQIIKNVQIVLGTKPDGYFGPHSFFLLTQKLNQTANFSFDEDYRVDWNQKSMKFYQEHPEKHLNYKKFQEASENQIIKLSSTKNGNLEDKTIIKKDNDTWVDWKTKEEVSVAEDKTPFLEFEAFDYGKIYEPVIQVTTSDSVKTPREDIRTTSFPEITNLLFDYDSFANPQKIDNFLDESHKEETIKSIKSLIENDLGDIEKKTQIYAQLDEDIKQILEREHNNNPETLATEIFLYVKNNREEMAKNLQDANEVYIRNLYSTSAENKVNESEVNEEISEEEKTETQIIDTLFEKEEIKALIETYESLDKNSIKYLLLDYNDLENQSVDELLEKEEAGTLLEKLIDLLQKEENKDLQDKVLSFWDPALQEIYNRNPQHLTINHLKTKRRLSQISALRNLPDNNSLENEEENQ